jgi:dihydroneopterin aldolase/2-amino-4-hydroxy-6-hydroxymethyldihydropteridine diphosphokinase
VLEPWLQVDPDAVLPGPHGGPVTELLAAADDRAGLRSRPDIDLHAEEES